MGYFDELEKRNIIKEKELSLNTVFGSAKATFEEAEALYEIIIASRKKVNALDKEKAYAFNNAIATQLALICELYLKSIYILENNKPSKSVDELWSELRNPNRIDPSRPKSASGHHLDILIENLSLDSRIILKNRIASLDRKNISVAREINVFDILKRHGLIEDIGIIYPNNVDKYVEEHKNTFVNARYGGQMFSKPDIRFLELLTSQIRVLAKYKISPSKGKELDITKYKTGQFPKEIAELYYKKNSIISKELVELIGNSDEKKEMLKNVAHMKLHEKIILDLNSHQFYFLIRLFNFEEVFNILETEYPSLILPSFYESINPMLAANKAKEEDYRNKGFIKFCIDLKVMIGTNFQAENIKEILDLYHNRNKKNDEKSTNLVK